MKHLFLQAPVQAGKSTLLQHAMEPFREHIGGFVSQRLKDKDVRTCGFRLCDYSEEEALVRPYHENLSNIFMSIGDGRGHFDLSLFETWAIPLLKKAADEKKLILLDEIGGGELKSAVFREFLDELLLGDVHCIGIIKAPKAAANTGRGIGENLHDYNSWLHSRLKTYDAALLFYEREKYDQQRILIENFIREAICGSFMTD